MINFHDITKKKYTKQRNPNWPKILDDSHRILINESSASGKTSLLFNLINHHSDIDKVYWYA